MLERLARELAKWRYQQAYAGNVEPFGREAFADENWRMFEPAAVEMLDAMREPTDLMGNGLPSGYKPGSHSASDIWRSLIDAAKEGK